MYALVKSLLFPFLFSETVTSFMEAMRSLFVTVCANLVSSVNLKES